ncbi:MAG: AtpZ/AtpI family protein [Phycisphaerales bacterium]|nr:MAG: AtpZ/AtpI family protein [Phycisphaerales bacterium]
MSGPRKRRPAWVRHYGLGIEFAAAVAGFGLVGYWIDRRWNSDPWGVVVGAVLGLIGATYNLVRGSTKAFKEAADEDEEDERRSSES